MPEAASNMKEARTNAKNDVRQMQARSKREARRCKEESKI
jgi:hypothetical protein